MRQLSILTSLAVLLLFVTTTSLQLSPSDAAPVIGVISRPVTNLRSAKTRHTPRYDIHDPHQNTQLQYGECVQQLSDDGDGWYRVKTVNTQYRYKADSGWDGYDGFVREKHVTWFPPSRVVCPRRDIVVSAPWTPLYGRECSVKNGCLEAQVLTYVTMGTMLELCDNSKPWGKHGWACVNVWIKGKHRQAQILAADVTAVNTNFLERDTLPDDTEENRSAVMKQASRLLGYPYFWGGYSARSLTCGCQSSAILTGVDCSGLTGLAMRSAGLYVGVPRDAHDMFLMTHNATHPRDMQPGDFFFFGNSKGRMTHIMAYWGDNKLIEATSGANATRVVSLAERFQNGVETLEDLQWGMPSDFGRIYFGTPFVKREKTAGSLNTTTLVALGGLSVLAGIAFVVPAVALVSYALGGKNVQSA